MAGVEQHLRQKRVRTTATADRRQLSKCEKWGPALAAQAIDHSVGNNYQGLFPPRGRDVRHGDAAGGSEHRSVRRTRLDGET